MTSTNLHTTTGRWRLGVSLALFTALMWSVAPIALKVVLKGMDPYTISWYRFLISAVALCIYVPLKHGRPNLKALRGYTVLLLLVAVAGLCGNYALFTVGLDHLPPSAAIVVIQTAAMFLLLGGVVVFKEKYSGRQLIGLMMLIAGLTMFFNQRLFELFTSLGQYTVGVLLILGAALTWSIYALAQKQLLKDLSSETIMLVVYLGCSVLFMPAAEPGALFRLDWIQLILLIFCGLNTVFAYGAFSEALDHLEASRVSAVLATIPIIAIVCIKLLTALFPGFIETEELNLISVAGALLVVAGSMISSLSRSP
jgi:drug/metabolite transporter (DMT)-like permease